MDPHPQFAICKLLHGERVVDFRGRRIVDRKRGHHSPRQINQVDVKLVCGILGISNSRKSFKQELVVMKVVRRRNRSTAREKFNLTDLELFAGSKERLSLQSVLIRTIK